MGFCCQFCQPMPGNGLNTAIHRLQELSACTHPLSGGPSVCQPRKKADRQWNVYAKIVFKNGTGKQPLLPLWQRKEKEHMEKQKYQMDLSFLENYDNSTRHYQPFDLLATPGCIPLMVMCSKKPEPAAWSIIGTMYSVHFLHYRDMEDYIIRRGLTRWTDEHDRKAGLCLSGVSNRFRIY